MKYGAALVVMAIGEQGRAVTAKDKASQLHFGEKSEIAGEYLKWDEILRPFETFAVVNTWNE